ncbi:MAG: MG2 domain-containing protein, partial [Bacteroidota bacterium]
MAQDYPAAYESIEKLNREGKFRSALEEATKLYERAAAAGDEDQMLKALAHRASYTFRLEEDSYEATLRLLLAELADNPARPAVAPVLHFLVGQGYAYYAQQNSYRLRNATATTQDSVPGPDVPLADWNLRQLGQTAEDHLLRSLELAREQRTRLQEIPAIVTGEAEQYALRPTLYDLLAEQAVVLLDNPLLHPDLLQLPGETDYLLLPAPEFTQLDLSSLEKENKRIFRKLSVYQDLLAFHLEEKNTALLLHDRQRIAYARELGAPDSQYLASLEQMLVFYEEVPLRDLLLVDKAALYNRSDEVFGPRPKVTALAILDQVSDKTPRVANMVVGLRRQITATELRVNVQQAYGKGENLLIQLNYKNVERVYHRLVAAPDYGLNFNGYGVDEKQLVTWRQLRAVAQADFRLAENDDYESHTTETWLPAPKAGVYYLLTSTGPKFDLAEETVSVTRLQVSNLALVEYNDGDAAPYYKVLDRTTGAPRNGVRVTIRERNNRRNDKWRTGDTFTTGPDGRFAKPRSGRGRQIQYLLEDRANDDRYASDVTYVYDYDNKGPERIYPVTPLFTDRSIYRPGQTVHVYGVTLQKLRDQMPELLTNEKRTLTLYDVNGQEMGTAELRSDAFSRFSHSFKLPEGGLTGTFRIQTDGGSVNFRVEEYKRPRFQVELNAPDYAVAGEMAIVEGKASLYAGPGLNDAKVSYRVFLEEIRYWWWGRGNNNERELVDSGETTTGDDGRFSVSFVPERTLAQQRRNYRYVVEVDVADETGETHAAQASVGLRSAKPVVSVRPAKEILDVSDSLTVRASGSDENIAVSYRIVRVEKPNVGLRQRRWDFPDRPILSTAEYRQYVPDMDATASQPLEDWVQAGPPYHSGTLELTDGEAADALALAGFRAGHYRIEWTYPDGTAGEPTSFQVVNTAVG